MATILIVEDEAELVKILRSYLEASGYSVLIAKRGDQGLALWETHHPDLVLLDLNLPGMDGLDVARAIRRKGETPIIMLTARVEETDRLVGLELGADDYITKPYSPREVVARVRAVLRRSGAVRTVNSVLRSFDLVIDLDAHTVTRGGDGVELTPTEFNLLVAMVDQPGRVFNRLQLLEAVQGTAYEGYDRTIDAHIKNLRAKLEADPKEPQYIETVYGVGYRFRKE
ncbi:response regulators consisting of a CheY-like receiver domain and a winged-helix DNA-binding domain [Longilinea arvoryzae]|uniref:Response regulators consisting of a CheY-like receiver domain and a winged-helix DNA-binding domain n=1 Tax=Longilinea arvoryzae TaxID=360412 RepID=A0A0S7BMW8_9CHLR|nr:response regulator transcription factor [Longilinea arvoryzae]GAP15082.1 response regulators consisting of a CheY-like receiver domain and a winged-helix DNA-binding domain [Longilinea arvoryzae]